MRTSDSSVIWKQATIGHTFFPADWTADDIMKAGDYLFKNGTYRKSGNIVSGEYRDVKMTGWLTKAEDGTYVPSTFYPKGR